MKWIIATQPTTTDEKPFKWWWFLTYKTIYPSTSDIINLENEKDKKGTMVPNINVRTVEFIRSFTITTAAFFASFFSDILSPPTAAACNHQRA